MKRTLTSFLIVIILILSFSLGSKELKIDDSFLIGKLDNKFTYYIKKNNFQEKKASLRLLVKVGSALETQEERGLAHFLEHLVFRGSENYEDFEIIKYLESIGSEFGPDTNAYTTFDKTCYMFEIPLENKENLEKGIAFLSDFAFRAKLKDVKIDKERLIILDELRSVSSPYTRVYDKHLKVMLENTSYEDKNPIGKEEVIKNCSYETIRNFYKKWYTPHNMALIAVGDFDENEVKGYIEKYFSLDIENNETPDYVINPNENINFSIVNDSEISLATIELVSKKVSFPINSKKDLKESIMFDIIFNILNERYRSISQKTDSDFIYATFLENGFLTNLLFQEIYVQCWANKILTGLEKAVYELIKLKKLGIKEDELKRAIKRKKESINEKISNLDKIDNCEYISKCFDHFISGNKIFSKKAVLDFEDKILNKITFKEISSVISNLNFDEKYSICITLPQNTSLNQIDILTIIEKTKNLEIIEENEKVLNEQELLIPKLEIEGAIKNIDKNEKTKVTIIEFENGLKVFLKPTDLKKNEIILRSYAIGGIANVKKDLYDTAKISLNYFYNSGIAGIDLDSFNKLLDLKNSSLNIRLSYNLRNISADTTKKNFEDIIKLINRIFTTKNYQNEMWNKTLKIKKEEQKFYNLYPDIIFEKEADKIFTSNSYLLEQIDLERISLENAKLIIDSFFSNPKDFIFFIVGDFEEDCIVSILQKYLGSISNKKETKIEFSELPNIYFPQENSTEIIRAGKEDKSFCLIGYDLGSFDTRDLKQWYLLKIMRPIIKERLFEFLRYKEGKTYSPVNYSNSYFFPDFLKHFNYFIGFSGPQNNIESIKNTSIIMMNNLINKGITQEEFQTAKKIVINDIKNNLKHNSFIIYLLMNSKFFEYEDNENYEELINSIDLKQMNTFIKILFSKEKYKAVIWLPNE